MEWFFVLLIALVFVFLSIYFLSSQTEEDKYKKEILKQLARIKLLAEHRDIRISQTSMIEADKLLDKVLKNLSIKGETLGDRLKNAEKFFTKDLYSKAWEAHKLRNQLVHESDFKITKDKIKYYFNVYSQAINLLIS